METQYKNTLTAVFLVSTLIGALAFIQTPEFVTHFRPLAKTDTIQLLAPRTTNTLKYIEYLEELKTIPKGPDFGKKSCALLGKYFHFDTDFKAPQSNQNGIYKGMLAACILEGEGTKADPAKAADLLLNTKNIPPKLISLLAARLVYKGQPAAGVQLLERDFRGGNMQSGLMLGSLYMNGSHGVPLAWDKAYPIFVKAAQKGEAYAAFNVALMDLQGRPGDINIPSFVQHLEQSLAKKEKANLILQTWAYENGIGYTKDPAKAAALLKEAETAESKIVMMVTDFFNIYGWGQNRDVSQSLLLYFYQHGQLDFTQQRELFFEASGPTPMFEDMKEELLLSGIERDTVIAFLDAFSQPTPVKGTQK